VLSFQSVLSVLRLAAQGYLSHAVDVTKPVVMRAVVRRQHGSVLPKVVLSSVPQPSSLSSSSAASSSASASALSASVSSTTKLPLEMGASGSDAEFWSRAEFVRHVLLSLHADSLQSSAEVPFDASPVGAALGECMGQLFRCGSLGVGVVDEGRFSDTLQVPCMEVVCLVMEVLLELADGCMLHAAAVPRKRAAAMTSELRSRLFSQQVINAMVTALHWRGTGVVVTIALVRLLAAMLHRAAMFEAPPVLAGVAELGTVFGLQVTRQQYQMLRCERVAHSTFLQALGELLTACHIATSSFASRGGSSASSSVSGAAAVTRGAVAAGAADSEAETKHDPDAVHECESKSPDPAATVAGDRGAAWARPFPIATSSVCGDALPPPLLPPLRSPAMTSAAPWLPSVHDAKVFKIVQLRCFLESCKSGAPLRLLSLPALLPAVTAVRECLSATEFATLTSELDADAVPQWGASVDTVLVSLLDAVSADRSLASVSLPLTVISSAELTARLNPTSAHAASGRHVLLRLALIQRFNALLFEVLPLLSFVRLSLPAVADTLGRYTTTVLLLDAKHLIFKDVKASIVRMALRVTRHSPGKHRHQDEDESLDLLIGDGGVGEGAVRDVAINRWHGSVVGGRGPHDVPSGAGAGADAAVAVGATVMGSAGGAGTAGGIDTTRTPAANAAAALDGSGRTAAPRGMFMQMFEQIHEGIPPRRLRQSRRPWRIEFEGEGGQDAGGLFSESLTMLVTEVNSGATPLFLPTPNATRGTGGGRDMVVPNPRFTSAADLSMFEFVGRLMGVGMRLGFPLPFRFPSVVWKQFVGADGSLHDLDAIDHDFALHLHRVGEVRSCSVHGVIVTRCGVLQRLACCVCCVWWGRGGESSPTETHASGTHMHTHGHTPHSCHAAPARA
jgi:hypothetical protein